MRKKNHQKRNASGGKVPRKQEVAKVKKSVKRKEHDVILQIQNLINEDIINRNLSNCADKSFQGKNSLSCLNCGSDESDVDESSNQLFYEVDLSEFVSPSSDSENDSDDEVEEEIDSEPVATPNIIDGLVLEHHDNSESLNNSSTILNNNIDVTVINSYQMDEKENIADMMNKPLLSLCNTPNVTKPVEQIHIVDKNAYLNRYKIKCSSCPAKFMTLQRFDGHMRKKHPDNQSSTNYKTENSLLTEAETNANNSIKKSMSKIIKDRIMKLLQIDNGIYGGNAGYPSSQNEMYPYNIVAEKLADKIVNVSEKRLNRELSLASPGNGDEFLSDFEL